MFQQNYSISFYNLSKGGLRNTKTTWGLIPDSPPMIPLPERMVNYIEIPGRPEGPIDMTDVAGYKTYYNRISGSWTFYKEIGSQAIVAERYNIYNLMRSALHGRRLIVVLDEDPGHYYKGRLSVGLPSAVKNPISITVNYDLDPIRWNWADDSIDNAYLAGIE